LEMDTFVKDLKFAFGMLRRSPGFTATAIGALALGIGANTAIFSVVNTVLLKPLPYPQPDRMVQLMNSSPQGNWPGASVPKYNIWRAQTQVLEDVAAFDGGGPGINMSGGDRPEQLRGIHVSYEFFPLFGAQPALLVADPRTFAAAGQAVAAADPGKRMHQKAINPAENRGVHSYAQRQREHGSRREPWAIPQDSDAIAQILEKGAHSMLLVVIHPFLSTFVATRKSLIGLGLRRNGVYRLRTVFCVNGQTSRGCRVLRRADRYPDGVIWFLRPDLRRVRSKDCGARSAETRGVASPESRALPKVR